MLRSGGWLIRLLKNYSVSLPWKILGLAFLFCYAVGSSVKTAVRSVWLTLSREYSSVLSARIHSAASRSDVVSFRSWAVSLCFLLHTFSAILIQTNFGAIYADALKVVFFQAAILAFLFFSVNSTNTQARCCEGVFLNQENNSVIMLFSSLMWSFRPFWCYSNVQLLLACTEEK